MPRVGTATSSLANGSAGGDANMSHNSPTNSSGCDPTWISSATGPPTVGAIRRALPIDPVESGSAAG